MHQCLALFLTHVSFSCQHNPVYIHVHCFCFSGMYSALKFVPLTEVVEHGSHWSQVVPYQDRAMCYCTSGGWWLYPQQGRSISP